MLVSVRAATAVALLAGFYLLALVLLTGLVAIEVLAFRHSMFTAAKLAILVVPALYALGKALLTIERHQAIEETVGVRVTPQDQPELWRLVRELARRAGTPAPDEITVVAEVNAVVSEQTRFLGLRVVTRKMFVGAPLLACLTEAQLAAVLAHELGHYGHRDIRLSGLVLAGRNAVRRVVSGLSDDNWFQRLLARLFVQYAKVYFRVSAAICRRQEFAADGTAADVAGSAAAAGVLRELPAIDAAWTLFLDQHLAAAWTAGYLPDTFFDRFAQLNDEPELQVLLDEIRASPPDGDHQPYDSHPPTPDRIAAIERLARPGPSGGDRPATDLLRGDLLNQCLRRTLADEADTKTSAGWVIINHVGARRAVALSTRSLLHKAGGTLGGVLDALDAGRVVELGPDGTGPGDEAAGPRARREFATPYVRHDLAALLALALADSGRGSWTLSWAGDAELLTALPLDDEVIHAAVAGDTTGLRTTLAAAGVGLDYHPV
ncbi:M48 family metalloprotease [Actinoplanes sp. NPDC051346]|uniref:M48 family metalloprotease n=1 Tax=Actinoplanes sp. NPDC051346 TaxID=3155048 RepID=UPI003418A5CB